MNKQDTAKNRALIEKAVVECMVSSPASASDEIRHAVYAAIGTHFPGSKNAAKRDDLVTLYETMLNEEFERIMREEADRNRPTLCECL